MLGVFADFETNLVYTAKEIERLHRTKAGVTPLLRDTRP
jgi:hypothetical protein